MLKNDFVNDEQTPTTQQEGGRELAQIRTGARSVVIPQALPMRLQTLDLLRHVVIAPNEKRYVVATFDDSSLGRGYVTAVYPQQNNYLTLVRLVTAQFSSASPQDAVRRHIAVAQAVQQGKLNEAKN